MIILYLTSNICNWTFSFFVIQFLYILKRIEISGIYFWRKSIHLSNSIQYLDLRQVVEKHLLDVLCCLLKLGLVTPIRKLIINYKSTMKYKIWIINIFTIFYFAANKKQKSIPRCNTIPIILFEKENYILIIDNFNFFWSNYTY